MPRPATGELRPLANGWEARVRIDGKTRKGFALLASLSAEDAASRCRAMATTAQRLRAAGHADEAPQLLDMAARARPGRPWEAIHAAVDAMCAGSTEAVSSVAITFRTFAEQWTGGDLAKRYPDHVKKKRTADDDAERLKKYVYDIIGDVAIVDVTLDHAEQVMANIPEEKSAGTRKQVAQVVSRVLSLSVYPGRLRASNPIPKGWLPNAKSRKAKECLYPDEDAKLLACPDVPLLRRLAYGFLAREGMRTDELANLEWRDIDLQRGKVNLDHNKTDDPRDWDLDPGVRDALRSWRAVHHPHAAPTDRVFAQAGVPLNVAHLADQLRRDLMRAGITRSQLFERSAVRQPIRAHDLRATFVTVALATGKTETWVADRTGHRSSGMIQAYRRKARTWSGLSLGTLAPLSACIPELSAAMIAPGIAPRIHRTGGGIGRRSGFRFRRGNT